MINIHEVLVKWKKNLENKLDQRLAQILQCFFFMLYACDFCLLLFMFSLNITYEQVFLNLCMAPCTCTFVVHS